MEKRDFFISYTGRDEAWARWIADTLKGDGYTVYAQMLDIGPGDNFLDKMNEFLKNSGNFIAVWSEAYAKSRFCMTELQGAFHEWHKERINCLLIFRIDRYPMEPLYAGLVHVDLSDTSAASEKKLLDAVQYAVPRQEDAEIFYQRGEDFFYGKNSVSQNYTKAREYYERAAAKGHADALFSLGFLYEDGCGVRQDYAKAREYYKQATAKGNVTALYNLGYLYSAGLGVKQDYAKAREYYEQAAAKGYADALFNLGWFYHNGKGVSVNYAKAQEYYAQAAAKGDADALRGLGVLYENGQGVKQDYAKAREYYEQAALKGDVDALWNLACFYEDGIGVKQDYAKALEYYQKAADAGDEDAPAKVEELRKKLNF